MGSHRQILVEIDAKFLIVDIPTNKIRLRNRRACTAEVVTIVEDGRPIEQLLLTHICWLPEGLC
jgi:hypothetical protein